MLKKIIQGTTNYLSIFIFLHILIACSGDSNELDDTTPNTLYVTQFSLPNNEAELYEHHSFTYILGIAGTDDLEPNTKIIANVFLVDSEADGEVDSADGKPSCFVGSTEIVLVEAGDDVVVAVEGRPDEGCYNAEFPERLFSFAVLLEANNTLLSNEEMNDDNYVVLTQSMRNEKVNQQCLGDNNGLGCVIQLTLNPSPGIDVGLSELHLESNIVLNYNREFDDVNTHDEMHTPNTEVTIEVWADGLSLEQLELMPQANPVHAMYAIKPLGLGQDWLPLTVQQHENMSPKEHSNTEQIYNISGNAENHTVNSLFIEGETYDAVGPGGIWEGEYHFEIRACLVTSFIEVDLPFDNEASNNCLSANFFLTERLEYNPDIYEEDNEVSLNSMSKMQGDSDENTVTKYNGLYKKLEVAAGDSDSLEIGMSFVNQARFGVLSTNDELTGIPKPGSGVPFATIGSTLEAHIDGFIDAELLMLDFTHTLKHKEVSESNDWAYKRSYNPSVLMHIFGMHYVDIEGSLPLDGILTIDNDDLESISKLFVKDEDSGAANESNKISFAEKLCSKTILTAIVAEVNIHSCITSDTGVDYGLTLSSLDAESDGPFDGNFTDVASLIDATVWINPHAALAWRGGLTVDLGLVKGDLDIVVDLMKLDLQHKDAQGDFQNGGSFNIATGAMSEFEIMGSIGTQAYLREEILNGKIVFDGKRVKGLTIKCCFYPKATWKNLQKTLYSWDGIIIGRQKLWNLYISDAVAATNEVHQNAL